jgi:hypothetical protein
MSSSSSSEAKGSSDGTMSSADWNVSFGGGGVTTAASAFALPWYAWAAIALVALVWVKKKA